MTKNLLRERVEAMTFYGCNDEAYELWRATCELAYQMHGAGNEMKTGVLVQWAENMASNSKCWALETYGSLDETDNEHGSWG